jgi:DNA-binding response OmpR family regulator
MQSHAKVAQRELPSTRFQLQEGQTMAEKILVVDDEPESLKLFGYSLHRQGYEVVVAQSGKEALEVIDKQKPDLIILDIMMPGMDGYEVCRMIRANPKTQHLPVIMLTAKAEMQDKLTGFEVGADDYIHKPVTLAELFARVKAMLARSRASGAVSDLSSVGTRAIAFLGAKGGVGTSTLAVSTAVALTQQNLSVVLVELRPWGGTATQMLKVPSGTDLGALLSQDRKDLTPETMRQALVSHASGLSVLPAPQVRTGDNITQEMDPLKVEAILIGLTGLSDFLILDLGTDLHAGTVAALRRCNRTILVSEHCPLSLRMSKAPLAALCTLGLTGNRIDVVVNNRTRVDITMPLAEAEALVGQPFLATIMPMTELLFRVNVANEGRPAGLVQRDNVSIQAIAEMARTLAED